MTRGQDTSFGTRKKWMIISWRHIDHMDGAYGELLATVEGTYEEAAQQARLWIPQYSPVGVCGVIV